MKYIKLFETTSAFNAFKSSNEFVTPHVSLCKDAPTTINYEPTGGNQGNQGNQGGNNTLVDPYLNDPKLVFIYNVTSTEEDTPLFESNYIDHINSMEIDGVELNSVVSTYRFNTTGEHVVKYDYNSSTLKSITTALDNNTYEPVRVSVIKAYIPNTIDTIGQNAFNECVGLTSVNIPSSVTSINMFAFCDCSSLTSIRCAATVAPSLDIDDQGVTCFRNISQTGTLYVPTGATGYDAWLSALPSGWTKVEY